MQPERRPLSLALRITLVVVPALAVILVAFTGTLAWSVGRHFEQQDVAAMRGVADVVRPLLARAGPAPGTMLAEHLARSEPGHMGVLLEVRDGAGQTLFRTVPEGLWDAMAGAPAASGVEVAGVQGLRFADRSYRAALLQQGPYRLLLAMNTDFHEQYLHALWRWLAAATVLSILLVLGAVCIAVRWGHAPLRRISRSLHELSTSRLHLRLDPAAVPLELQGLVGDFNAVLDRIEEGFRRVSQFSADIAHELRTPLTNLTTQLQVELGKPRSPERYRETLHDSLEELQRLSKMVADMLLLAQADHDALLGTPVRFDLADEVRTLFDYFEALAEERQVTLALQGDTLPLDGDPQAWRRALGNLLSNALRYTPAGGQVVVRLGGSPGQAMVEVENPGPTIAPEHLPHLFDRFYRADPSRRNGGEGAGLGLAIVRSIVAAHGGTIAARSREGRTCFTIVVPRPEPA